MKLEKRSAGAPEQEETVPKEPSTGGKKPVLVYIMILFIVAFLLMTLSFLMHQRSNSEAMNRLQNSVNALQQTQATQDQNIQLQNDLEAANTEKTQLQKQVDEALNQLTAAHEEISSVEKQLRAMEALYTLQQQYAARDYEACRETIASMEQDGLDKLLPAELTDETVTSPAQRYLQLREALENK